MARKGIEVGPMMQARVEPEAPVAKKQKPGWCTFEARGRCYVESAVLESEGQSLKLSPAASYRQQKNKNIHLVEGTIPVLEAGETVEDLQDGDPIVGQPLEGLRLLKQ